MAVLIFFYIVPLTGSPSISWNVNEVVGFLNYKRRGQSG